MADEIYITPIAGGLLYVDLGTRAGRLAAQAYAYLLAADGDEVMARGILKHPLVREGKDVAPIRDMATEQEPTAIAE